MAFIDHESGNGLTARNATIFAQYDKFYQNIYPGNGPLSGAVNPTQTSFNRAAYNNTTNRDNIFNQTDFFYKVFTGPVFRFNRVRNGVWSADRDLSAQHRYLSEQHQYNRRQPICSDLLRSRQFHPSIPGSSVIRHSDARRQQRLHAFTNVYLRPRHDEITRWLQIIVGARFDRFDKSALDNNTNTSPASSTIRYSRKLP